MAKRRTSVVMQKQVLELRRQGKGPRAIARCLGLSRNTVRSILRASEGGEILPPSEPGWRRRVDWDKVHKDWGSGVTLLSLHREWAPEISYTQFRRYFRKLRPGPPQVTMRLEHKPGERTHFDFTDGISLIDARTGEKIKTQLFCGTLPFSSKTWGEFVLDQKQLTVMEATERFWHNIGGVTPYAVFDNLKSAVQKAHLHDPEVNKAFCDFANHWGFAVLPTRPYKARDKASVESAIGVIQRGFYNEVRDRQFYSLRELNETFWEYLTRLNTAVMKDYGVSREDRFMTEKPLLKPLATTPFEVCDWRSAKVHPDCHVQVDKRFYSVPFRYVGQTVKVRLTQRTVEVFSQEGEPLSAHARLSGQERFSTTESHYPEQKVGLARFEVRHAKSEADKIGPKTKELVDQLLDIEYPLKYLRRVQGILRLASTNVVTKEALEHASTQAMAFGRTQLQYIKACAIHYQVHGRRPKLWTPLRAQEHMHLHNHHPQEEENYVE